MSLVLPEAVMRNDWEPMPTEIPNYYAQKLAADKLRQVYGIASPRVRQYLDSEIDFVMERIKPGDRVLELGCGYGRVLEKLATRTHRVLGIDTSIQSLLLAAAGPEGPNFTLAAMNAVQTAFRDDSFDVTVCIQNGISAFKVDRKRLFSEAVRITRPGGRVLFSSYADSFWPERLEWFRRQAEHGLLGEIDESKTGNGVIVCKDGFKATTIGPDEFNALGAELGYHIDITIVDDSSVFCELIVT
jgi:2-polyprenyl-6-hydroxyphenyl methylase/3-demethylubiquinone-9 3-methyltransferase